MEGAFVLHHRLAADSVPVLSLPLCDVRLQDNAVWPWLVLVPRRPDLREIHELSAPDRARLIEELALASRVLQAVAMPDKLNVGALGNVVPQLHVHVVARRQGDPAWPGPVWGSGHSGAYEPAVRDRLVERLRAAFASDGPAVEPG